VDVAVIDEVSRRALRKSRVVDVYVVDEIGKMECLSSVFVEAMRSLVDSRARVVATIAQRGGGFIDEVKRRRDATLWTVTRASRDALPDRIVGWVEEDRGTY
jgi:nucleoside-triphosphatase